MMTRLSELRRGAADPRLLELAAIFQEKVTAPAFPCIYTKLPFAHGDLTFSHHHRGDDGLVDSIVHELQSLVIAARQRIDAMHVVFVDDDADFAPGLEDDRDLAGRVVRHVLSAEPPTSGPNSCRVTSDDPNWTLVLDGLGLFLNISSPRHVLRRSRDVGPAFTIIAQARASFDQGSRADPSVRNVIRRRIAQYDDVPPHPALGTYGDPSNREALQYFLGDSTEPHDITVPATVTPGKGRANGHQAQ